jgi:cytochrome c2
MHRSLVWATAIALLLSLWIAATATAGGWATFTLDEVPMLITAGQPLELSFVARGHGHAPFDLPPEDARFVFRNVATGEEVVAPASPSGRAPGHHVAEVTLPAAGAWTWELQPGPYPAVVMEPLQVVAAAQGQSAGNLGGWLLLGSGLLVTLGALTVGTRDLGRRRLWLAAGALGVLLLAAAGFWLGSSRVTAQVGETIELPAYGKALFAAKGCQTCHRHDAMTSQWTVEVGPNLTHYRNSPEFLAAWLANPQGVRPRTQMPALGLSEGEIAALVAFLNAD